MPELNATELAARLDVSKARISQYVSEGKLEGCFSGDGRARRFDLDKVAAALGKGLHPGQMLGNGAATKRAIRELDGDAPPTVPTTKAPRSGAPLDAKDPDRYELARIQNAEEDARRKRRDNQRDEGRWVLADEVQRQTARAMTQEVAQFEAVLRDAARAVADRFGLDYREVRKVLIDEWRKHRGQRSAQLVADAEVAPMTEAETAAQV
ncbi:hypothetical protein SAMN05421774_11244 [Gemmobacter megaterium]|uniref:Helix-turn-helix domain-containing protein n=1 Tax=Gemmobacter megaterium TaxID=1086013 RepID=A0A1N7QIV0_9RHOB|nr:hypothetical protein [Gemmobacter megaterium]GGE26668.1 hypothetical protein GCM10011345_35840 [Gemmobacter megaterium]SIT22694.1 hypothetical protein SAMN05421774_11244 [Gemmobacter megaterium]